MLHASVFKDLLSPGEPFGDGSAAGNRGKLWDALQQGYDDADERKRLANLTLEMIGGLESGTYPKLKAKCNESKCLVKPILLMLIKFDDGSDRAAHRIQCYQRLDRMNVIMVEGGLFLTEEAVDEYSVALGKLLRWVHLAIDTRTEDLRMRRSQKASDR